MKKILSLFAAVLFAGSMMASESVDFSAQGYENQQAVTSYDGAAFSIAFAKGTNKNAPTYYTNGTAIRCYGGNTMTFTATSANITSIVLTFGGSDGTNEISANVGKFEDATWTGDAASVVLTIGGTTGNRRIKGAEVSFAGDAPVVYDTLTVAAAIDTTSALADNATSAKKFYVEGYAVYVADYYQPNNNQDFFLVDNPAAPDSVFKAFRATPKKDGNPYPVLNGDKVRLFGALQKYVKDGKTQLEIMNPTVEFLEEVEGDRTIVEPEVDTITVARALAIGDSIGQGKTTTEQYVIQGFVTALTDNKGVANADGGWAAYKNQCMWVADTYDATATTKETAFFVYQGVAPEQVTKGAKIRFTCAIKNYSGMIETAASKGAITILQKGEDPDTTVIPLDTITVARALEIGQELDSAKSTDIQYVIEGYVSSIEAPYDTINKNETFWIYGEKGVCASTNKAGAFEVYRGKPNTEKEIGRDARVYVTCKIQKYGKDKVIESAGTTTVNVVEEGVPDVPEVKTVAEILTLGAGLSEASCERYEITGYVSAIKEAYSDANKNETFWITDTKGDRTNDPAKAFQVYRGRPNTGKEIGLDAQIKIVTKITNFKGTIENPVANTTFEVLEQGVWKVDTISVDSAIKLTKALEAGAQSVEQYAVKGFVAQITGAYDATYGNATFQISDDRFATSSNFSCYRAKVNKADSAKLVQGAYVLVTGNLDNNSHGMQMAQGSSVEFLVAPKIDTLTVTVAEAIEAGLALEVDAMSNAIYVVTGVALDADPDTWDEGVQSEEFTLGDNADAADGLAVYYAQVSAPISAGCTVEVTGRLKKVSDTEVQLPNGQARIVSYPEAIENVVLTEKAQKVVVDGVIYIIRDNKMFDIRGAQVR